jgi:uncharacterized SAM-binding protein YcdF (DUF218 family)
MRFREICRVCRTNLIIQGFCVAAIAVFFAVDAVTRLYVFLMFFLRFLALSIIVYNAFSEMIKLGKARKLAFALRWTMRAGYAVFIVSFVIVLAIILKNAEPDLPEDTSYIVVLGAGLNGTEPSRVLRDRLDTACDTMEKYPEASVILCGGQGFNELIPESLAMYNYLIARGADPDRLIRESRSTDTVENIKNASEIIVSRGGKSGENAVIVTCGFHMMRSKLIAKQYNLTPYGAAAATRPSEYHYYVREYFSILIYYIKRAGIPLDTSVFNM